MLHKTDDEPSCNTPKAEINYTTHWNKVYANTVNENLGWYESNPQKSLELIEKCNLAQNAKVFIPGAGSTTLVDELVDRNYTNIIANDISKEALTSLKSRVGNPPNIKYIVDDLTNATKLELFQDVDLWIDRAVLHFFLKKEEQKAYFDLLRKIVAPEGFVIISVFNLEGAKKCSGLDVFNYNAEMIEEKLGKEFKRITTFDYMYVTPSGAERPYVYTLFQRQ